MFDTSWVADLDADAACTVIEGTQGELREQEWRELVLAAHWAVLHDPDTAAGSAGSAGSASSAGGGGWVLPGAERSVRAGGDGTPRIGEFACAELGLVMGTGFIAASSLIRDAVDLQHRHPLMWAALGQGKGRVWKARQVARMTHAADLSGDQARFVDAACTPFLDTLTWSGFTRLVEAKIIEADPEAAEARRQAAAMARFVATGQSTEHGLKTLIARASAGEIIYFVAVCDRIAQILALHGDPDPLEVRRSKALAILANPAHALTLLEQHATTDPHPHDPGDPHPGDPDAPDDGDPYDPDDGSLDAAEPDHAAAGDGAAAAGATDGAAGATAVGVGRVPRIDPDKLRPRAVLYVRVTEDALRTGHGVAHVESGIGPLTIPGLTDLLGHYRVTLTPVLDLRDQVPIDAYEVPHRMREALRLARPSSVFPYTRTSTIPDIDHTTPYQPRTDGGPPGQTRIGNLGPLVRFAHRIKTHAPGWTHHQPHPGTYLWRTPHGYWFRVDNDGTHPLGRDPDATPPARPRAPGERT